MLPEFSHGISAIRGQALGSDGQLSQQFCNSFPPSPCAPRGFTGDYETIFVCDGAFHITELSWLAMGMCSPAGIQVHRVKWYSPLGILIILGFFLYRSVFVSFHLFYCKETILFHSFFLEFIHRHMARVKTVVTDLGFYQGRV